MFVYVVACVYSVLEILIIIIIINYYHYYACILLGDVFLNLCVSLHQADDDMGHNDYEGLHVGLIDHDGELYRLYKRWRSVSETVDQH